MLFRTSALLALLLVPGSEDPVVTSFTTLAAFEFKPGMTLPSEVTALHEKQVKIQGFMRPENDGDTEVQFFLLINDSCGCQGTPKLNEIVYCAMPEDTITKVLPGVIKVTGKLFVGEEKEGDDVVGIYYLDVEKIE